MRKFCFILFLLLATPACSHCIVKEDSYVTAGGSEEFNRLTLLSDNKFIIEHETWQPGNYTVRKKSSIKGSWSCKANNVLFKINNKRVIAKAIKVGSNPLGIKENTTAIRFSKDIDKTILYLANETFYPQSPCLIKKPSNYM